MQSAFTRKKSNDRSPNMEIWIATVSLKNSGKYAGKSESDSLFEPTFLPVTTNCKEKKTNKDGSDWNQKGRRQQES